MDPQLIVTSDGRAAGARRVALRPVAAGDRLWLLAAGLSPEKVGRQYHWAEAPLQLFIAPARARRAPDQPAALILVDGRRAGYIGPNPMSGNLEYFLSPWARGGTGGRAITEYLSRFRTGDRPRRFFVSHHNPRSRAALLRALGRLGWVEGDRYWIEDSRLGWQIWVK